MVGNKYLSDAVHMDEFSKGHLNFVAAPVGSGKTHWALHTLVKCVSAPHKMLYLIDTVNGKEQLLAQTDRTRCYSEGWHFTYHRGLSWFGEIFEEDKIVVMTYAKFGLLATEYQDFG